VNHVVMSMGTDEEFCRQIDDKIVETLWQTESKGIRKQSRRLVARRRLSMSYEMGGLEIPLVEDIAHGLRCNFFGRMYNMTEIGDSKAPFVVSLFERFLNQRQVDRIKELVEVGGSQIYGLLADRSRRYSTFFSQVFRSMSKLVRLAEEGEKWAEMPLAGHGSSAKVQIISLAEALVLKHHGIINVSQLFCKHEDRAGRDLSKDTAYPRELEVGYPGIVGLCKHLRNELKKEMAGKQIQVSSAHKSFLTTENLSRISIKYRKWVRQDTDRSIPGPPSFFTRQREGIIVPSMEEYKKGYRSIIKMDIPSKTKETAYLILNRQNWTSWKARLSRIGEDQTGNCTYCGRKEDTRHMLVSCEVYSQRIWEIMGIVITRILRKLEPECSDFHTHLFEILYNRKIPRLKSPLGNEIMIFMQEMKREIIWRRFKRYENQRLQAIQINDDRIKAHMSIVCEKIIKLRKYRRKQYELFSEFQNELANI